MSLGEEFNKIKDDLIHISQQLYDHPELGDEEYESSKLLINFLESHHFKVESGIVDRPTAFKAEFTSSQPGPTIAYLAEYDALPGIGHGCGHNLIATISVGAGVVLSKFIEEIGGKVIVFGTPAEETNGAKVPMSAEGVFDDVDVAMMVHPSDFSFESGASLAMDAIQFAYQGKAAHAAAAPEEGINALDGVLQLFNGINALREHVASDVRMHGIISEGGKAANIVPEQATAQFYFRAEERQKLNQVVDKVNQIAQGAALATGTTVEISHYELSYDDMRTNQTLSETFNKHLRAIGQHPLYPAKGASGSLDMGNVSQVVPAIHPYIGLNEEGLIAHTQAFADKTVTEDGRHAIHDAVLSLAHTGHDIITHPHLLVSIQEEFNRSNNT